MYSLLENDFEQQVKISVKRNGNKFEVFQTNLQTKTCEKKFSGNLKTAIDEFYSLKHKKIKQKFNVVRENDLNHQIAKKVPVFSKKVPVTYDHHVGIEIEFVSPFSQKSIAQLLKGEDFQKHITLKKDRSVSKFYWGHNKNNKLVDYHGHEIVVLLKQSEIKKLHEIVSFLVIKAKAKINDSCGLHVHLDMRQRDVDSCYTKLVESQKWFFKMNPTRRDNKFCKMAKIKNFRTALRMYQTRDGFMSRFLAVNPHAYTLYKTLEVRVHQATLNSHKMVNWINFLIKIVDSKKTGPINNINQLQQRFNLSNRLVEYIQKH